MNRGIEKTEQRIKHIYSMIDKFNSQMQFREHMSNMYCIQINKDIENDKRDFWKSFFDNKVGEQGR